MRTTALAMTLTRASVCLQAGSGLSLTDAAGVELVSRTGRLWLTMEGDTRDINLRPGDPGERPGAEHGARADSAPAARGVARPDRAVVGVSRARRRDPRPRAADQRASLPVAVCTECRHITTGKSRSRDDAN